MRSRASTVAFGPPTATAAAHPVWTENPIATRTAGG
jgi:hypothetical protein